MFNLKLVRTNNFLLVVFELFKISSRINNFLFCPILLGKNWLNFHGEFTTLFFAKNRVTFYTQRKVVVTKSCDGTGPNLVREQGIWELLGIGNFQKLGILIFRNSQKTKIPNSQNSQFPILGIPNLGIVSAPFHHNFSLPQLFVGCKK